MSNEYTIKKTNPEGTKTRWVVQRMSKSNQPIGKAEIFSTEEAAKRFVASKSEVKESRMSSIMKGILSESGEPVSVIYIDGKASVKYTNKADAEEAKALMLKKHPKKNIEIKSEMRESEAIKGTDGKRCWKGKRYAGTVNGKDKCIPVQTESVKKKIGEYSCYAEVVDPDQDDELMSVLVRYDVDTDRYDPEGHDRQEEMITNVSVYDDSGKEDLSRWILPPREDIDPKIINAIFDDMEERAQNSYQDEGDEDDKHWYRDVDEARQEQGQRRYKVKPAGQVDEALDWQNDPMNWQGDDKDTEWYEKRVRSPLFMVVVAAGTKYTRKNTKKRIINFTKTSPTTAQVDVGRLGPYSGIIDIDFNRQALARWSGPADEPYYDDQAHTYRRFYVGDISVTAEQAFNLFQYKKHKADTKQTNVEWEPLDEDRDWAIYQDNWRQGYNVHAPSEEEAMDMVVNQVMDRYPGSSEENIRNVYQVRPHYDWYRNQPPGEVTRNTQPKKAPKKKVTWEPLDEASMSDVVPPLIREFNLEHGGSERWAYIVPLHTVSSTKRWRRGDGSYYTDPNRIEAFDQNNPEQRQLQSEFYDWLIQKPGVKNVGGISGEFRSSDYSEAAKYKGVIFVKRGTNTEYFTPSKLRNSSVWNKKNDNELEKAPKQQKTTWEPLSDSSIMKGLTS